MLATPVRQRAAWKERAPKRHDAENCLPLLSSPGAHLLNGVSCLLTIVRWIDLLMAVKQGASYDEMRCKRATRFLSDLFASRRKEPALMPKSSDIMSHYIEGKSL